MQTSPQRFVNGEIHDWYRIVLGYSDHLVSNLLDEFNLSKSDAVLDPFSGSGTTVVECMKRGIDCWGVDANPSSCFAAKVKTRWDLKQRTLKNACSRTLTLYQNIRKNKKILRKDPTHIYLENSGMIDRGWINQTPLLDVVALKLAIQKLRSSLHYKDALMLALVSELVGNASNVRFGPELYCGKRKKRVDVIGGFKKKIDLMCDDLKKAAPVKKGKAQIIHGDSRSLSKNWLKPPPLGFSAVISSPPYPTEHDYTRNARLELVLLEAVVDKESLQRIKRQMIRSHTKGIYVSEADSEKISKFEKVERLARRIDKRSEQKNYGFARLYGRVVREYFGGMSKHFDAVLPHLKDGAKCAYVVGDQASYFGVKVSTAKILAEIAIESGFEVIGIRRWRQRWATSSGKYLSENILFLQKKLSPSRAKTHLIT